MSSPCTVAGWGVGPYGQTPWGGSFGATPGGPIPVVAPFDIYCVGPCGPMSVFDTYNEVQEFVSAGQLVVTFPEEDMRIQSGGAYPSDTARLLVNVGVPNTWTFEFTANFRDLPPDFSDIVNKHIFFGTSTPNDFCAGLFFSSVGIMYTGSVVHDGFNNLVLNSTTQFLPNSLNIVQEGIYYTIRIVIDGVTETTYIYITETALLPTIGHQLKYILPAIPGSASITTPLNGTTISVRGTLANPSMVDLDSICLGSGLIIPNLPPIANAGSDMAARACSVIRFDGSLSFDPEGTTILYNWRLIDGPENSENVLVGHDGATYLPSPFTNKLHSETLEEFNTQIGITVGDVILFEGDYYDILSTGTDGNGFHVVVDGFVFPSGLAAQNFKLLRQGGISGRTTPNPTFYPDITGLYKFTLTVFDGQLYSIPSEVVANVTELPIARGCTPDLSFIWGYLSDFWKLVDDTEIISTFWSAAAQVTASELLALWQHDYSKSLRDIQRTFQRRWLHYDLFLKEPLVTLTKVNAIYSGVHGLDFTEPLLTLAGKSVIISSPLFGDVTVYFQGTSVSGEYVRSRLESELKKKDSRFTVYLYETQVGGTFQIHITAPIPFTLTGSSDAVGLFTYPSSNDLPRGSGGVAVSLNTYWVPTSLLNSGISAGDYLILGENSYYIERIVSDPSDDWTHQRLVIRESLTVPTPSDWVIARATTSSYLDFYKALVSIEDSVFFEVINNFTNELILIPALVLGTAVVENSGVLLHEVLPILPYLAQPKQYSVFVDAVFRRRYVPISHLVKDIPNLQELIDNKDDTAVLRQNVDYIITTYRSSPCIKFVASIDPLEADVWQHEIPPQRMWAETTYLDNSETIESNFGIQAEFTLDNLSELVSDTDYLSAVRGLWYAHFNGPTIYNLRVGSQILLGLPFAEEKSTIEEIRTDFSSRLGRLLLRDVANPEIIRSYTYPKALDLEINPSTGVAYTIGDTVNQFSPLVKGVEVIDYVKEPTWFINYLQQGEFFEVEKFFKFLVRVDSDAFSLSTLMFVRNFILRIKPTYTYPIFVVRKVIPAATVDVLDSVEYKCTLFLYDTTCGQLQSVFRAFDISDKGDGIESQFDSGSPILPPPTYPVASPSVYWGYDRDYVCPEDLITATACITLAVPTFPTMDSIYAWDTTLLTDLMLSVGRAYIISYLPAPGEYIGAPFTAPGGYTITQAAFDFSSPLSNTNALNLTLIIEVNTIDVRTVNFTVPAGSYVYQTSLPITSLAIIGGDVVRVRIEAQGGSVVSGYMSSILIGLGGSYTWAYDVLTPAGTYCAEKLM